MLLICKLFVAPVKIISFFFPWWAITSFIQLERMKLLHKMKEINQKKKERKKKKKRHCEVLKKYYCLCMQNWEEQIKKHLWKS